MALYTENVTIFGGLGFLGRALTRRLQNKGAYVVVADNRAIEPAGETTADINVDCNVRSPNSIYKVLKEHRPGVVYWLPAKQGYGIDFSEFARTNVVGAYCLHEVLSKRQPLRPRKIILAGSQAIYTPGANVGEGADKFSASVYGMTKLQQEQYFLWFCDGLGIPLLTLRYSILLGAGQSIQSTESGLLRNWLHSWRGEQAPSIFGDGKHRRDFVSVNDAADVSATVAFTGLKGAYNVAGFQHTIIEMGQLFQKVTGCRQPEILDREIRPGGEYTLTSSPAALKDEIGWEAKTRPRDQIREFIDSLAVVG